MVDFCGFHVGKYSIHMDGMGYIALKNGLVCPPKHPKLGKGRGESGDSRVGNVGRSHFLLGFHIYIYIWVFPKIMVPPNHQC